MIPKFQDAGELPASIEKAAYEIVAHVINQSSEVFNITLKDLKHHDGRRLGSYEISVRKIE